MRRQLQVRGPASWPWRGMGYWERGIPLRIYSNPNARQRVACGDRCPLSRRQRPGARPLSPGALGAAFWVRIGP